MKATTACLFICVLLGLWVQVQGEVSPATCQSPSQDRSFCLECRDFYHLYEGQCYIDILGCENYVFGNICRKCKKGFILVNNECCDKVCMSKIYNEEHHQTQVAQNKEEVLRKAEVDGLQRSIAVVAKNSVKSGQSYDILMTRSQRLDKIFRYFVELDIEGKHYIAINDYNIVTGEAIFVDIMPKGQTTPSEITLTEDNIHGNAIYERGYKFIYEKFGLQLYELEFSRMTAITYGRSTELKFVFIGKKVLLISIMVGGQAAEPYVLWKEEKTNVQQVKDYIQNLKKVEEISKEYNFKRVFSQVLTERKYREADIELISITPISQTQYTFLIFHRILRLRFRITGSFSIQAGTASIEQVEEVFSAKLQDMKEPEAPSSRVIPKESFSSSVEAKQVFDYLYKIQPTFHQNLVQSIKVEEGQNIKKIFLITQKDGKDYRMVVMKDTQAQQLQLIDEGFIVVEKPRVTVITTNNDGTTTVTTSKIDTSKTEVRSVMETLKKNNITTQSLQIESIQYTEGPRSVQFVAVLADKNGNPTTQVTISENKQTKERIIIDYKTLEPTVNFVKPVENEKRVIPASEYYKPEVLELISKVESKVEKKVVVSKVNRIEVTNTTSGKRYDFVVEDNKGNQFTMAVMQFNGANDVNVVRIQPVAQETSTQQTRSETKSVRVDNFGIKTTYTNDQRAITSNQNSNVAITAITNSRPELIGYQVVGVQTKKYVQQEEQILIMTNGTRTVQVTGQVQEKTLKYVMLQVKEIPIEVRQPIIIQTTIPATIYPVLIKENQSVRTAEEALLQKFKIFKNKVPNVTTVQTLREVDIVTFNYQINQKKFVAVLQNNKTDRNRVTVLEVSPIEVTVQATEFSQTTSSGKTVTTSNSVQEIQQVNQNTTTVLTKITDDYPLLKKQNVSHISLTETNFGSIFQVTYTEERTQIKTTVTVRSDKKSGSISIKDVESEKPRVEDALKLVQPVRVVIQQSDYQSESIKKVIQTVNTSKISVEKITRIVAEKTPTYVTYNMQIQSGNKVFEVTVIDSKGTQEVVAVRSPNQTQTISVKPATVKVVDTQGNTVVKTNDQTVISTMTEVKTVFQQIQTIRKETVNWNIDSVITVDYGTVEAVTLTVVGPSPSEAITSTVFYDKKTSSVEVVSIQTVTATVQTEGSKEVYFGTVAPITYPVTTIPNVAIPEVIKTDQSLSQVIDSVQQSNTQWTGIVPVSTEIKKLSTTVTQYTMVMQVEGARSQVVVIYNTTSESSRIITTKDVKLDVKPFYITQVQTESGPAIESNDVNQITQSQPEFPQVLEFSDKWLNTQGNWSTVNFVQVLPSTVKGGNTVFTIQTSTTTRTQKIEVSYNSQTKQMSLVDLQVLPVPVVFPTVRPIVRIDPAKNPAEVKEYVSVIEESNQASITTIKEVLKVEKIVEKNVETIRTEVLAQDQQKYFITIIKRPEQKPEVVHVQPENEIPQQEQGSVSETTDSYGNTVTHIEGTSKLMKDAVCSVAIETIKTTVTTLQTYTAVTANTVQYGEIRTVTLLLEQKETGELVKTTSIFNQTTNKIEVISVQLVERPVVEGPGGETPTESTQPVQLIPLPEYPTKKIPQVLIAEVVKTDKSLEKVVKTIQQSEKIYQNAVTVSVEVQRYSSQISNYIVVVEVEGKRTQVVVLYNEKSTEARQVSVTEVKSSVESTFSSQTVTEQGSIVYSSNNVTSMMTKFRDLRFVISETTKLIPTLNVSDVSVAVLPQDSVNSYTIVTTEGQKKVTVELNYEVVTNKTYVTNYKEEPITVFMPTRPVYTPQVLTVDDKIRYIDSIRGSGVKQVEDVINVVQSKTTEYSLYKETILTVETKKDKTYNVKVILENGQDTEKVLDVSEVPQEVAETPEGVTQELSSVKTDSNGNIVITSYDEEEIKKNIAVTASTSQIIRQYPEYRNHMIKYIKTVNFGLVEEVMTTMINPTTGIIDVQTVSFFNKETKVPQIITVEAPEKPTPQNPSPRPFYPTVVLSDSAITETIKKDTGLKTVLTTIHQSATRYQSAIPLTVEVQAVGTNIVKYVIVLDVVGKKEQKVFTYNKETKETKQFATTIVPSVINATITTETIIENKKATVSTSVEQIKQTHPRTLPAVEVLRKEHPDVKVDSVVVIPGSGTSTVTLISKKENKKEYTINKFISDEKSATKVEEQVIQIRDIAMPKPAVLVPKAPSVILEIPTIEESVRKIINVDTTQTVETSRITSVTVSEKTNVQVYSIKALDAKDKQVSIEIIFNPANGQSSVVDVSEVKPEQKVTTTTQIKGTSGVSEITTTNTEVIKNQREFKQISGFIKKNHPEVDTSIALPVVEKTEKYQRSVVKTVVLKEETKMIQATYVLDQRTQGIVELEYQELPLDTKPEVDIVVKPIDNVYTPEEIPTVITQETSIVETLVSISKVDPSLKSITPIHIEIKQYGLFYVIVIVYDTPDSNSRILTIYNTQTKEARVIDYSKVSKDIESSTTVETINELGQTVYYTDTVTETITTSTQFVEVMTVADELIPSIKDKPIKGFETVTKGTGKEYKIVTVDNGVINQVVLQFNNQTKEAVLISSSETTVAIEAVQIIQKKEVKSQKIDITTLQGVQISDLVQVVVTENPSSFDTRPTVISGSVKETAFAQVYEMTLETKTHTKKTVTITKDKTTNKIIVNDIQPIVVLPPRPQITTTTQNDNYGNVVVITNDQKTIKQSKEIQAAVEFVFKQIPSLSVLTPTASNTVTYGNVIENTIVFTAQQQSTVQVTTITNKTTQVTIILDSRIVPVTFRPAIPDRVRPVQVRPIRPIQPAVIRPVLPIQVIPTPAIPIAIRKFPEIKNLITSVEKIEGKVVIQELKVEEFMSVKKYTAVSTSTQGKSQHVYIYDKSKDSLQLLESIPVITEVKPIFLETTTTIEGEEVTISSSVEQISTKVPELQALIEEIRNLYSVDVTTGLKVIEAKGTTVKEVKIVVETKEKIQTIFTGIANGTIVKVVDVQEVPEVPQPIKPAPPALPTVDTTPEVTQPIKEVIFANQIIKEHYAESQITTIKSDKTAFVTRYEVTVVNKQGETAVVELVQEAEQPLEIVHIGGKPIVSVPRGEEPIKKEILVVPETGNKIVVTTDRKVIKTDTTIRHITQNIIGKLPTLIGYVPVKAETTTYGVTRESTVTFATEGKSSVQVTVIFNEKTNSVEIINTQVITATTEEKPLVQTIPGTIIKIAERRFTEIKTIISQIQTLIKTTPQVREIKVKDLDQVKIYTPIIVDPINPQEQTQLVYVFNKETQVVKQVDQVKITHETKAVVYEQTVDNFGQTVIRTNDIEVLRQEKPEVNVVLGKINTTYGSTITKDIKSVKVTTSEESTIYQVVAQINKKTQELTITRINGTLQLGELKEIPSTVVTQPSTGEEGAVSQGEEVDLGGEQGTLVKETIANSTIPSLSGVEIVSVKSQETLLTTLLTVETINKRNEKQTVVISVVPGESPQIVQVEHVKEQVKAVVTEESSIEKSVSQVTGSVVTVVTGTESVRQQVKGLTGQIVQIVPEVATFTPVSVKQSDSGEITWTTIVFSDKKESIQVTSLYNKTSQTVQVIDRKHINKTIETASQNLPESQIYFIPSVTIPVISQKLPEIAIITKNVSQIYKQSQIESIEIEVFEQTKKVVTVIETQTGRIEQKYLVDIKSQEVKLVETVNIPTVIKGEFFSSATNIYGEKTITTNNVTELVHQVPIIEGGIEFIKTKYPITIDKKVEVVKVTEFESEYKLNFVSEIEVNNAVAIVVTIDKQTGETSQLSTYSQDDIATQPESETQVQSKPAQEEISPESSEVTSIVEYLESSSQIKSKKIESVTSASKTTTVFGIEVVTIEAMTSQNEVIKTVVNFNPSNGETTINTFDIIKRPVVATNTVTEFKVDMITGTKITVTNDTTVLSSSEMMTTITQKIKLTDSSLTEIVLTGSATTEYSDKVKVVSLFTDKSTQETVQVISVFNKETSEVQVIETIRNVKTTVPQVPRVVFTPVELPSVQVTYPSIPATTVFVTEKYPQYQGKTPVSVIVESLEKVEFVTYIYQTATTKELIVVSYNKTSKESKVIESNPVREVKPFFYEQKKNEGGENVIVTNNLTQVKERIPETEVLDKHLQKEGVAVESIQTVELTVGEQYLEYKLVVKKTEEVKQYEYLVDKTTKEVKEINAQVISQEFPVVYPQKPAVEVVSPTSHEIKPVVIQIIDNPDNKLNNVQEIVNMTKQVVSKGTKFEIEYKSQEGVNKLVVLEDQKKEVKVIDERPIVKDYVPQPPVIVQETVDEKTKTQTTVYPTLETFKLDESSQEITDYLSKAVVETSEYKIESIRKESFGYVKEYDVLLKADKKAPIQVTVAKDTRNKNIMILEKKTITEEEVKSILDGSVGSPTQIQVSDIEKENIKVLSKLGLVKDIKEYKDVSLEQMGNNDQFRQATESVKQAYSAILNNAVIIKILEKKSLESNSLKVFYKAKDQIYQASLELNEITRQTRLTEFIKVGTQSYPKSEVNVYSDLCYGYQLIEDFSLDSNLDFITGFLKQKYDALKDASLIEAQEIVLQNGRINYKLYYKKDSNTVKYIVYYEPEYKRVLEVKGTNFEIGNNFKFMERSRQVNDPYFRKIDKYVRQNRNALGSASVMYTESNDNGQQIQFRTVYNAAGKTYRSIAAINKDNQNIDETSLSEVIEIPVEETVSSAISECNTETTKLDIHDLGKNAYFTECYKYIQEKYQQDLQNGQLLGASERTNFNIYTYAFYFIIDENQIITLSTEFDPLSQAISVTAEPSAIDLQNGYFPMRSDQRLTSVRNWLKDNNPDLSSSVLVSSMAKKFFFGTLYKVVFKVTTKYIIYIAYVECGSKEVKIYDTQEVDNYNVSAPSAIEGEVTGEFSAVQGNGESPEMGLQPKLKGFARPNASAKGTNAY